SFHPSPPFSSSLRSLHPPISTPFPYTTLFRSVIKVAAYTRPLLVDVAGALERTGELVAKLDILVHPVADGLHARPAKPGLAEEGPGDVREFIDVTVAAAQ